MTRVREARAWLAARAHLLLVAVAAVALACSPAGTQAVALAAACAAALVGTITRSRALVALAAATALGAGAFGIGRLAAIDAPGDRLPESGEVRARAIQLEPARTTRFGTRAAVEIVAGPARGARVLAEASSGARWGKAGDVLSVSGAVERPPPADAGGFDMRGFLRRRGLAALLEVDDVHRTGARRGGVAGALDGARSRAERGLSAGLDPQRAALGRGMVLGQDEAIAEPVRDDFRAAGLAHLLAVSGQNVMLLCALAWPLVVLAGLGAPGRVLALLALIALYVPLAGAGPSLQRAGVMGAAALVPLALGRASSRLYALGLAAVATLALNPRVSADPGWQLSFAAVVGILALSPLLTRARPSHAVARALADGVAVTVAATLATAPLLAFHFGAVSLASLPANLAALPAVAPVMWAGMVQAALGQLAAGPAEPVALAACRALSLVSGPLLGFIGWLARTFADQPWAQVALPEQEPLVLLVGFAAVVLLAGAVRRAVPRVEPHARSVPVGWRALHPRLRLAASILASGALAIGLALVLSPPAPPRALTVSFLDVGQGDATLIQDPSGAAVLFDGGRPEARVARLVRSAGVRRLGLVVATHQSADHHGGLKEVIERVPVGTLLENGEGTRDPTYRAMLAAARKRRVRIVTARAGQVFRAGDLRIRVIGPPPRPGGTPPPDDPNERALVTVVSRGEFDLFLSADAESPALEALRLPRVEAMKVPHHGSADPGLPRLLDRLRPQVAAIEVGADNPYRHPRPETMAALKRAVPHVYRTDEHGTIRLTVEGGAARVETDR